MSEQAWRTELRSDPRHGRRDGNLRHRHGLDPGLAHRLALTPEYFRDGETVLLQRVDEPVLLVVTSKILNGAL